MNSAATFLDYHPLANLFPMIEGQAFAELVEDVRRHGVREPIVLLDGKILDGRNRYRAGLEAGCITMLPGDSPVALPIGLFDRFESAFAGEDPLAWVISKNLNRRHLTDDQRRMVAARVANLTGRPSKSGTNGPTFSRKEAADMLAVDEKGVTRAKTVIAHGAEELQQAVDDRRVTVRMAADLAALPEEQQREIIALADPKALREVVRDIRAGKGHAIGTRSASREEKGDQLYETPIEAVRTLLALESFSATVKEPAVGKGAILAPLEAAGYEVMISDLVDRGIATRHGELQQVGDFLLSSADGSEGVDIVTNPPYDDLANAFAAHALKVHRPRKMALLLNWNFAAGFEDANRCFVMDECPPSRIYLFKRRLPMMHRDGWDGPRASSQMNTAWFVWEKNEAGGYGDGFPRVIRVDWKRFQEATPLAPGAGGSVSPMQFAEPAEEFARSTPRLTLEERIEQAFAPALVWAAEQDSFDAIGLRRGIGIRPSVADALVSGFLGKGLIAPDGDGAFRVTPEGWTVLKATAAVVALGGVGALTVPEAQKAGPTHPPCSRLPPAPGPMAPVEFSVGGMKHGSSARFSVHLNGDGTYGLSAAYEIAGLCGGSSPPIGSIHRFADALRHGLDQLAVRLGDIAASRLARTDRQRAAARAGLRWIDARRTEWGLADVADAPEGAAA